MIIGISGKLSSGKDVVARMIQLLDQGYSKGEILSYLDNKERCNESEWKVKRFADKLKDIVCLLIGCTREQLEDREFKEKPLGEEWNKYIVVPANRESEKLVCSSKEKAEEYAKTYGIKFGRPDLETYVRKSEMTPRKLMQLLGTEAGREILHPNIWVNALFADYNLIGVKGWIPTYNDPDNQTGAPSEPIYPNWIIPDTRFPNEAEAIKDRDGVLIRVHRPIDQRLPELWKEFGYDSGNKTMLKNDFYSFLKNKHPEEYQKHTHPSETSLDTYSDWDYTITNSGSIEQLLTVVKSILEEEKIL